MTLEVKRGPSCGNGGYGNCGIEPEGTNAHREAAAHVLMSPGQAMSAALIPAHTLAKSDQRSRPIPSAGRTPKAASTLRPERLKGMGLPCATPHGAFYAFPSVKHLLRKTGKVRTSYDFANIALERGKVAVIPGTEFGRHGEGYIRLSYATNYKLLEKGLNRLEKVVK